jgi:adenylate cyclase class 2
MVEAELKAVVRDVNAVRSALGQRAPAHKSTYVDRYFDYLDRRLAEQGCGLRVRTITDDSGQTQVFADVLVTVLTALGVEEFIAFRNHCVNYRLAALGRELLATLVTVSELEDQTFIELETMAPADDLDAALEVVRSVLRELGISEQDLTAETYTDAIAQRRR